MSKVASKKPAATYIWAKKETIIHLRCREEAISLINNIVEKMNGSKDGSIVLRIMTGEAR